ncbi:Uncharacterized membrane protein [Halopseudomonas xinjiangensis]|uniref:Uncharacterized membrane protein n=1 Tax=Halopseudomonas xinjiangensis TaxID=487184 RepID=A0A1H1ML86_9GAMM|nr:hypothetical protein [Halopseudomonas xinjiangensis]SDR87447.1 Uncharacterized membrane protein [Halopseudomonas xinjiangensis]
MTKSRHPLRVSWALVSALTLSGCALLPGGAGDERRLAGLLETGGDGWEITPCDATGSLEVVPTAELQQVFRNVAQPGQTGIFVELEGRIRDQTLRPTRLIRMQSTGRGCAAQTDPSAQWIAAGPHPSWRLTIGSQGIEFDSEAAERTGPSPVIAEELPDGSRSFRTERDDRLELWLYPQECFNHAGDFAHMSATLIVDGKRLSGCAYEGQARPAS